MTYGWAILAAVIVVGVLWFLIGSSSNLVGDNFVLSPPFSTVSVSVEESNVLLEIRNGAGKPIEVTGVDVQGCTPPYTTSTLMAHGESFVFLVPCTLSEGDRISSEVKISYSNFGSDLTQFSLGSLSGRVKADSILEIIMEAEDAILTSGTEESFDILSSGGIDYISQDIQTTTPIDKGGRATFSFTIPTTGDYIIEAVVDAPSTASDSFFINVDGDPVDSTYVWDVQGGVTSGFELREISFRGAGSLESPEFNPWVVNLDAGAHELRIWGREANTKLDKIIVKSYP